MRKAALILTLGTAFSLAAAEPQFGVQGAVSLPLSTLSDNGSLGLELGGHGRWYFQEGHGLMARADLAFYSSNNGVSVTGFELAADYTYPLERRPEGAYLLAGLSQANYHTSFPNHTDNDSALGLDLGAGYDLDRHLGLQARFTTHSLGNSKTYGALNVGVTYSF